MRCKVPNGRVAWHTHSHFGPSISPCRTETFLLKLFGFKGHSNSITHLQHSNANNIKQVRMSTSLKSTFFPNQDARLCGTGVGPSKNVPVQHLQETASCQLHSRGYTTLYRHHPSDILPLGTPVYVQRAVGSSNVLLYNYNTYIYIYLYLVLC